MTPRRVTIISLGLFAIVWTADRLVKALVLAYAPDGSSLDPVSTPSSTRGELVAEGPADIGFSVSVHRTSGLVFDTVSGSVPLLVIVVVIITVLGVVFVHALRRARLFTAAALALVLAGALGNFTDRLAYGYVIDFLVLPGSAVVNLADLAILTGAALILVDGFRRPAHGAHPQAG